MRRTFKILVSALFASACSQTDQRLQRQIERSVIYGYDDRIDVYAEPDARWRGRARASVVALIPQTQIDVAPSGVSLTERNLHERYALCPDERFAQQPSAADCSGVLIDTDLLLTAGHCFDMAEAQPCRRYRYVFDYFLPAPGKPPTLNAQSVYDCRGIVAQRTAARSVVGDYADFAVVQLDRPVSRDRVPLAMTADPAHPNEPVTVIGYPSGLPAKLDHGARVRAMPSTNAVTPEVFMIDSDTFAASSGSAVLSSDGQLLGNIVSGAADYTYLVDAGCQTTRSEELVDPDWEKALGVAYARRALCEAGWPNPEQCGRPVRCGDGFCSAGELDGCKADCGDPNTSNATLEPTAEAGCSVTHIDDPRQPRCLGVLSLSLLALARHRRRHRARLGP